MLISPAYVELNRGMHERKRFGIYGERWAGLVHDFATKCGASTVLDYGCGQGTLRTELLARWDPPYDVLEYDPAISGKECKPQAADVVFCGDVMEHVEPECVRAVFEDIRDIARRGVVFCIATTKAKKHLPDGRNAHLIVEDIEWWLEHLLWRWRPVAFSDFGNGFLYLGSARRATND